MQSLSKGEWIRRIIDRAGIMGHTEDVPYFMNIDAQSEYFNDVQAAVEWHILDPAYPFEPDEPLSNEWTAFTLVNLSEDLPEGNSSTIKDISKRQFPKEIATAVSSGLLKTDSHGMFRPKKVIERDAALTALDQVIEYINNRHFEKNEFAVDWNKDLNVYESEPLAVNEETMSATVPDSFEAEAGDIVTYRDGQDYHCYKVNEREGNEVKLEEFDIWQAIENLEIHGSFNVNFDEAEIYDGNGNLIQARETGDTENDHIHLMAKRTNTFTFEQGGFNILCKVNGSNFSMSAEKKIDNGRIYAAMELSGIEADCSFKTLLTDFKKTYLHVKFNTSETLGIEGESKSSKVMDFSRLNKDNFIGSLKDMMQNKEDAVQTELKIASIAVPLEGVHMVDLVLDVKLQIKTSGKAEIVLSQSCNVGYDYEDGNFRLIKDNSNKQDLSLKADTSLTANMGAKLNALGFNVLDLAVKAGVKAGIKTKVHLYDEDGEMHSYDVDVSADLADEASSQVEDVVVCADASGNWILDLVLCSSDCLANRFFGETKYSILNEKNAPLFKGASQHFENWHAVDKCTRKSRPKSEEREVMDTKGKISLEQYSIAVHAGTTKSISVLGLPAGYTINDLIVSSSDPSVASVSGLNVTGVSSGSAIITISTADGSFTSSCNVLVPQESHS